MVAHAPPAPPAPPPPADAAAALALAEANLRAFVEQVPDPVAVHCEGRFVLVNESFARLVGRAAPAELLGLPILSVVHPDDRDYVRERLATPPGERAGATTREHHLAGPGGAPVPVEVAVVPVTYGGQRCSLNLVRDLRERKRLEAQLVLSDRMAALGRLAAAVGHEINNPLAYAMVALDLLRGELDRLEAEAPGPRVARLRDLCADALEGSGRVRAIVRDLKTLSGGHEEATGPVDLRRLLDLSVSMASHEIRHRARLVRDYRSAPALHGSEARLGQVFLNLLVNAAQAIPEGDPAGHEIRVELSTDEAGRARVDVVDTGSGVAPDLADRIFEPFFTTKGGQGTGLGLSISSHVVRSLGGTLTLEPTAGRGTRFRVTLPPAAVRPGQPGPGQEPADLPRFERALVVDDEPRLASLVRVLLGEQGVVTAASGAEAIARLDEPGAFDVVVCDLHMDGLSGMDVHEHVRRTRPGLERRMVLMTGGAVGERAARFVAQSGCAVLDKPFDRAALIAAVAAALSTPPVPTPTAPAP